MEPRYPNITVKLIGEDGNAFGIIGKATRALLRGVCHRQRSKNSRLKQSLVTITTY